MAKGKSAKSRPVPTNRQREWLQRGLDQPGGKLPLFDLMGRKVNRRLIETCLENGWAEHWFYNPIKPDWIVCKLTPLGREMAEPVPQTSPRKVRPNKGMEGDLQP